MTDHPAEVAARVRALLAVDDLDVLARAHEGEGLRAIEVVGPGLLDVEPGAGVEGRVREVDVDPSEGVDQLGEADEVDLHVLVDRHAEGLLDGEDEPAWPPVVGGVDLARPVGLGDRQIEVARDRHHLRLAVHEAQEQHCV